MSDPVMRRTSAAAQADERPLIAHVVYRFDTGGLENGVVNLINRMPVEAYRHAIVALTEATDFRQRILRDDVPIIPLHKGAGHGLRVYPQLFRVFRELRPSIVHTRNLAALEAVVPAWCAGVSIRIHGEHGRDVNDLDGSSRRYQRVRQLYRPWVSRYVALSRDLEQYLIRGVGVNPRRIAQIYNGVDTSRFSPVAERATIPGCPFTQSGLRLVGTVGRLQAVKDQVTLAQSFVRAARDSAIGATLRLVIVGEGPLRAEIERVLAEAGLSDRAWLPGDRSDIPEILRGLDCFVLPSLAEGVSNTLLEAMATGIPVIATRVGGNPELIADGVTGTLVPPADVAALAAAMIGILSDRTRAHELARAASDATLHLFSLDRMVQSYLALYDGELASRRAGPRKRETALRVRAH